MLCFCKEQKQTDLFMASMVYLVLNIVKCLTFVYNLYIKLLKYLVNFDMLNWRYMWIITSH